MVSRAVVVLRGCGFVLVAPVAALWWSPFYDAVSSLFPADAVVLPAISLAMYAAGVLLWLVAFVLSLVSVTKADLVPGPGSGAAVDPAVRRRRMVWAVVRVVSAWVLAVMAAPVAFVALLTVLIAIGGTGAA
ncbi:hypothetical protein [Bifidobacterium saguinibicoloris]|uniref:hypothetical protein n=1 Tax=Bifidobacterium saguinibicoloris TaxID=2834433 RepID=UPI001C5A09F4|nr:hypothetical protein [Bifidobacterium saguinibicoloris]MBW3081772.1 hypothetical protein [Bifidobacterium saguinibicoloris]